MSTAAIFSKVLVLAPVEKMMRKVEAFLVELVPVAGRRKDRESLSPKPSLNVISLGFLRLLFCFAECIRGCFT